MILNVIVKVGDCACPADHGSAWPRHLPLPEKAEQSNPAEQQDRRGGEAKNQRCRTKLFISGRKMKNVFLSPLNICRLAHQQ